eukprot:3299853-Rhodomonas_salina.1
MPLLPRPSLSEIPFQDEWNLSDADYRALQERRKAFKGLRNFNRRHYTRHNGRLEDLEMRAFCAAGYFIWRLGAEEAEVLMAWEDRPDNVLRVYCSVANHPGRLLVMDCGGRNERKLNFLGGCRDHVGVRCPLFQRVQHHAVPGADRVYGTTRRRQRRSRRERSMRRQAACFQRPPNARSGTRRRRTCRWSGFLSPSTPCSSMSSRSLQTRSAPLAVNALS